MAEPIRVAVTGVGGGVGQSVLKALSLSTLPLEVHAIDIQPLSAGLYRVEHAHILPPPDAPGALAVWQATMSEHGIQALIPGSDHDLPALALARETWPQKAAGGCEVLISDRATVDICRDKAVTVQTLLAADLPAPVSAWDLTLSEAADWARQQGYPIILKPRDGYASRGVQIIEDEESLRYFYPRTRNPMLQEYLGDLKRPEEFTCAVFVANDGTPVGTFMARRDLSGGATYRAEVGHWESIDALLRRIGATLRPRGPMNVQLRMTENGPVPFELNIRCSGTSAIRAHFGFNEPDMLLRHYWLGETIAPLSPRKGYALRYWNEVFIEDASAAALAQNPATWSGTIRAWP